MPDDVKRPILEHREVLHVASDQPDLDALPGRQVSHRPELRRRDVEDGCLRAQFGEDHGVPATTRRQTENASARQSHPLEAPPRIHEAPHARARLGRPAEGAGVVHGGLRQAFPHRLVVLGNLVYARLGRSHHF